MLIRHVGVAGAVVAATGILGVAAASGALFLSAVGSETLSRQVDEACVEQSRPGVVNPALNDGKAPSFEDRYSPQTGDRVEAGDQVVAGAMREAGLPAPYVVMQYAAPLPPELDRVNSFVTVFYRADALEHVEVLSSSGRRGVWLPDRYAQIRGLAAGDPFPLRDGITVPVAGIYRDLAGTGIDSDLPAYWCSWADLIVPSLENRPPPFVLVDRQTMYDVVPTVAYTPAPEITAWWYSPVSTSQLGLPDANEILAKTELIPDAFNQNRRGTGVPLWGAYQPVGQLASMVDRAVVTQQSVSGPVVPVAAAGTAVALLLVAAAGLLWVEQRSREVGLLVSRGVSGWWLGTKAGLEMLAPVALGGVLGWVGAVGVVRWLGPAPSLDRQAVLDAAWLAGCGALAALAALGILAAWRSRQRTEPAGARARRWRWIPWELALLGAAVLIYRRAAADGGAQQFGDTVALNPLLIAFPLVALLGALWAVGRLTSLALPGLRRRSSAWRLSSWLAIRRLGGSLAVTLTVLLLAAVPIGVLVYSAGLTASLDQTITGKAAIYTGADHALQVQAPPGFSLDLHRRGTIVTVIDDGTVDGVRVQVLGVDPETFGLLAAWDDDAVGASPADLLPLLEATSGPAPAILIRPETDSAITQVQVRTTVLDVDVVATAPAFPGLRRLGGSMLVVNRAAVLDTDVFAQRHDEVWTTTENLTATLDLLNDADTSVRQFRTPGAFFDQTDLLAITWTFGYLQTIAAMTGLIAFTALLLYVAARQRQRQAAHHLGARMGLSPRARLSALSLEVGALLGLAWLAGTLAAIGCIQLTYRLLEVNPDFPPPPLFDAPLAVITLTAAVAGAATLLTASLAELAARRTSAAEVLRLSG